MFVKINNKFQYKSFVSLMKTNGVKVIENIDPENINSKYPKWLFLTNDVKPMLACRTVVWYTDNQDDVVTDSWDPDKDLDAIKKHMNIEI